MKKKETILYLTNRQILILQLNIALIIVNEKGKLSTEIRATKKSTEVGSDKK